MCLCVRVVYVGMRVFVCVCLRVFMGVCVGMYFCFYGRLRII